MDQIRFAKGLQPSVVEVAGCKVRMFFSLHAAMAMEAYFGKPYLDVVLEILQTPGDDGKPRPPVKPEDQAKIVAILMEEAGQQVDMEDLLALHVTDFSTLCRAAQAEMLLKMPESKKKQESTPGGTGHVSFTVRGKPWASRLKSSGASLRRLCMRCWKRLQTGIRRR